MKKKIAFYIILILLSILITLVLYSVFYSLYAVIVGSQEAKEILTKATVYLFFLRLTGTLAFIFIGIATSLGALRNVIFSFYKKTAFWKIHTQWASSLGVGMATAHLTIYLLYELRLGVPLNLKLFYPNFIHFTATSNLVFLSTVALIIFTTNFIVTNIPGVTGKKWWKPLHIFNYLGFFLVLIHAYFIGSNSSEFFFLALYGTFLLFALAGSMHRFYKFSGKLFGKKPPASVSPSPTVPVQPPALSVQKPPVAPPPPKTPPQVEPMHVVTPQK